MPAYKTLLAATAMLVVSLNPAFGQDAAPDRTPDEAQPATGSEVGPEVELLDKGEGDRTELRYRPEVGSAFVMKLSTTMSTSQSMDGQPMGEMQLPTATVTATLTTDAVEDDAIRFTMKFDKVDVEDDGSPQAQQMQTIMQGMVGMVGKGVKTTRGHTTSLEFETPDGMSPMVAGQIDSMKSSIGDLSVILPEEPVGKGARWRSVAGVEANGMKMTQSNEYTVRSIEDGAIVLDVSYTQSADEQAIENGQLPPGVELRLMSLEGKGAGTSEIKLGWLIPGKASIKGDTTMDMTIESPQGGGDMRQSISVEMSIASEQG